MSTFEQHGFAGNSAANQGSRRRAEHAGHFQFAYRRTRMALDVTALLPLARASRQIVVRQFFARAASHFQTGFVHCRMRDGDRIAHAVAELVRDVLRDARDRGKRGYAGRLFR